MAVVGPITSGNLNAIVPVAESLKTPLLYATNFEGGKCSRYVFSFSTVPNQDMGQLLPYMNQTFGNTYFLLGADRVWPHQMFDIAKPLIEKLGGKVVGTQYTLGTETDFTPADRAGGGGKAEGAAVRAERRRHRFHPAGRRQGIVQGHHRRIPRAVGNRSRHFPRQGPEHVHGGAVRCDQRRSRHQGVRRQGPRARLAPTCWCRTMS